MDCLALSFLVRRRNRGGLAVAALEKIMRAHKTDLSNHVIFLPGTDAFSSGKDDRNWVMDLLEHLPDTVVIIAEQWDWLARSVELVAKAKGKKDQKKKTGGNILGANQFFQFKKNRSPDPIGGPQLFSRSHDAISNPSSYETLAQWINGKKRTTNIHGKYITTLICGENNILANRQANANQPYWRLDSAVLQKAPHFTDTILFNPLHYKMGNGGKLARRFEYLTSAQGYCHTAVIVANRQIGSHGKGKWPGGGFALYQNGKRILPFKPVAAAGKGDGCIAYKFEV